MKQPERGFDFLRVSIEARLHGPSIVTVTSAQLDDGSAVVARGLAEAFADAGQQTLLLSTYARSGAVSTAGHANLSGMTADQFGADLRTNGGSIGTAIAALRERFAVVVVDAEPIPVSTTAYELARVADAVLVSIRLGRKPTRSDQTTMKLLDDCKANVLGIVPTSGRAAAAATASAAVPVATPVARQIEVVR